MGLATGSTYHHVLETYGRARLYYGDDTMWDISHTDLLNRSVEVAGGYIENLINQDDFVWRDGDDRAKTEQNLYDMLKTWVSDPGYRWIGEGVETVGVEVEVRADFGSPHHTFLGYIDNVVDVPSVGHVGTDFKTAGRAWGGAKAAGDPRKLIQAPLYAEAYQQQTGIELVKFTYDVMTLGGKFMRVWVDVSEEARKPFIRRWYEMSQTIAMHEANGLDMAVNPDSMLCSEKWCDFWSICSMGEPLESLIHVNQ